MTNKTTSSKKNHRTLKWRTTNSPPTKRWWWYVGLIAGSIWLGLLLTALHQWTTLLVLIAIVTAILVVYRWKPREADITLDAKNVIVNGQVFPLEDYKSFRIEGEGAQVSIVLAPKKFFRLPVLLTPSGDDKVDQNILGQLEKHLRYIDVQPGILDRMTRWLKLG